MNIRDRHAVVAVNVVLAAVFATGLAATAHAIRTSWGSGYWHFDVAVGLVASVLALCRRFHRAWTAAASILLAVAAIITADVADLPHEPGPATSVALSVLIGSAVRTLPLRWAGAISAGGFCVVVGCLLTLRPPASTINAVTWINALAWLTAVTVGFSLRLLDDRRSGIADKIRRDERLGLARELHDVVAHHITGIVIQVQAAQVVARKHPDKLVECLSGIELAGSEALDAMRRVVGLLRVDDAAPPVSSGREQVSALVDGFSQHGPAVRLRMPDDNSPWPAEVASTVYRIVQEALTNVSRHAPHARSVTVTVDQGPETITVEVTDDAPPPATWHTPGGGYGLIGMRERVQTLGGTLRVGPLPSTGWSVLATLPVSGRAA